MTLFTSVSIFSANITTILGLGLAIDYGLFMVSRFREELRRQGSVEDAVARTMATAGRTVAFSGVTVAIALASLMLFPETFLRSMGYGGVLTVLVDMVAALTVMPALLSVLGPKVNSLRIRPAMAKAPAPVENGGLVPPGPPGHASAGRLHRGDRDRPPGPRLAVPAGRLGWGGRHRAADQLRPPGWSLRP